MRRFLVGSLLLLLTSLAAQAQPCGPDGMCRVAGGYYMAITPPGWDGKAPLGAVMHFHGFREGAADIVAREDIKTLAARLGALLVVPHGEGNTWSHPGSPSRARDEFAFIDTVMKDLAARLPIDRRRFLVSGFSQGAAMVWNLVCYRGDQFGAFLAIAGTFWLPQPESCPSGAQNLIQIHGVADRTVPLEGRPIRNGEFHQGDVMRAMGMMRRANACAPEGARAVRVGALACERMTGCASGKALEICLHPGGHDFDPAWLDFAWRRFFVEIGQ